MDPIPPRIPFSPHHRRTPASIDPMNQSVNETNESSDQTSASDYGSMSLQSLIDEGFIPAFGQDVATHRSIRSPAVLAIPPQRTFEEHLGRWSGIGGWKTFSTPVLNQEDKAVVNHFFERLDDTKDMQTPVGRQNLAGKLHKMLDGLANADLQKFMVGELRDACAACGDRVTQGLDNILMELDLKALDRLDAPEALPKFFALGVKHLNLQTIDHLAMAKAARDGMSHEELEVVLAYRVQLKDTIDLPTYSCEMLFENFAAVDQRDRDEAIAACGRLGDEDVQQFLQSWEPWQSFLVKLFPEAFEAVVTEEFATPMAAAEARDRFYQEQTVEALKKLS